MRPWMRTALAVALVLAIGTAVCAIAYRMMLRLGRLPEEQRILR